MVDGNPSALLAGGYGLFLKQRWLLARRDARIVVPLERWLNATPRVTKDLDLVIGLDLISDADANRNMHKLLTNQGFQVTGRPAGKRWQFVKKLGGGRHIVAELHVPSPNKDLKHLRADGIRVKHQPSLGDAGVHGRENPEAVGCDLAPFRFELDGIAIAVPNSLTWAVMKLTAMRDRWLTSQDPANDPELRSFSRAHAIKHGQDVCRVVAMMGRDENVSLSGVIESIRMTSQFRIAAEIQQEFFNGPDSWARELLGGDWTSEDFQTIQEVLAAWFDDSEATS